MQVTVTHGYYTPRFAFEGNNMRIHQVNVSVTFEPRELAIIKVADLWNAVILVTPAPFHTGQKEYWKLTLKEIADYGKVFMTYKKKEDALVYEKQIRTALAQIESTLRTML